MELKKVIEAIAEMNCVQKLRIMEAFRAEIEEYLDMVYDEPKILSPVEIRYLGDEMEIEDAVKKKCEELKLI